MSACIKLTTSAPLDMQVDKDLKQMLLKADAPKPHVVGYRLWPKAIPQFNVGHLDLVQVGSHNNLVCRHTKSSIHHLTIMAKAR